MSTLKTALYEIIRSLDVGTPGRRSRFVMMAGLIGILSGCETAENSFERVTAIWSAPIILPCPDYRILADAARVVQFKAGSGTDMVDVSIDGRLGDLTMECKTDIDKDTKVGVMTVDVTVSFGAKRGPANADKKAVLPYFLSVTDHKRNVLYREGFNVAIRFPGNQSALEFTGETIKLELPLSAKITSRDYLIYTGFKLNRGQLEYNRRIKGQKRR